MYPTLLYAQIVIILTPTSLLTLLLPPLYSIQATDLEITAKLILHTKETLNTYLSAFCEQPMDKIRMDTDR